MSLCSCPRRDHQGASVEVLDVATGGLLGPLSPGPVYVPGLTYPTEPGACDLPAEEGLTGLCRGCFASDHRWVASKRQEPL